MSQWNAVKKTWKMAESLRRQRGGLVMRYFLDAIGCGYRHGASPENYLVLRFYELKDAERYQYLTSGRSSKADRELNRRLPKEDARIMAQKHLFYRQFEGLVKREYRYVPDTEPADFEAFLKGHECIICKPSRGIMGHGIRKIHTKEIEDIPSFYEECRKNDMLVEECIVQHEVLEHVRPGCVNSIRINTARDQKGQIHLIGACLKCGGAGAVADNFHSGGIAYPLDLDRGCVSGPGRNNTEIRDYDRHPGTDYYMPGLQIPHWEQIRTLVNEAMERMPGIGYVGWDIAVTPDGCELIEGNCHWPGGNIIQLDGIGKYPQIQKCLEGAAEEDGKKKNILLDNYLVKNLRAYPVLKKKFMHYIEGTKELPEGFTKRKLFHDYLKVRRNNPEKRVSQSEYMIFGFYGLSPEEQKRYLTDIEATRLMRPYNNESEKYLKDKLSFLKNFTQFVSRGWLYVPEASYEEFDAFVHKYHVVALKPQYSSWGIGFIRLTEEEFDAKEDKEEFYQKMIKGRYLAEEFVESHESLAVFHPSSLNTLRVITFRNEDRFEVFGCGLRVGNNGLHVDNAHGGGIFCEIDPKTGIINTDGIDECANTYIAHPMTGMQFRGVQIPFWEEICALCKEASQALPCLRVVGWDVAILSDGRLELIEGNHSPGMNIVQAPAKHGVHDKFESMLLDYYGDPEQYI